ncbi:MAG: glycosyl transferase, partial [Ponticaulis sp.]|nr:glycosyl transferase [Ponticaulis sp.]
MKNSSASTEKNWQTFLLLSGLGLLLLRILTVVFTTLNLGPDEAQYWRWSTSFDWGYYSKPPMIAWVIGVETFLFGDAEWAIRIGSPLFHV